MPPSRIEELTRALCHETCAFKGEPACYQVAADNGLAFPPETCSEPGCEALAMAVERIVETARERAIDAAIECLQDSDGDIEDAFFAIRALKQPTTEAEG